MSTPPPPSSFFLPVDPQPYGNAHYVQRTGKRCPLCRKKPNVSVGRKDSAKHLKRTIRILSQPHSPRRPWSGPVRASLTLELPIPKTFAKWQREAAELGYITPIARGCGDRDNYEKGVFDALEGLFYVDDSQVDRGPTRKIYSAKPGYRVEIEYLPEPPKSYAEWKLIKKAIAETCDAMDPILGPEDAVL